MQHFICQLWSEIPTTVSLAIMYSFSQWMLFSVLPELCRSWLKEVIICVVELLGEASWFPFTTLHCCIYKWIAHSLTALHLKALVHHKKLQVSNVISVIKINLLSLDFLFILLNRLLHCICCNNTISNWFWWLVSREKYTALCGNVLQRQIFFGGRKWKSDG